MKVLLSLPKYLFLFLIRAYQVLVSPYLPKSCRFMPTCSEYGRQAFMKHNFIKALYLTVWRVLRCNPFNPGGYDPLP
ncbi:MAG: membrane protein insertion efficiency factor YidD [Candidatus Cloacimonetes bacterium HGW-Cloacimonetes-1]|nr:MAG: membrane protein insertion efficiency factor YidD [Candidatus Cloacimonetes bacterium HGW-Cloacimonetes-1]